MTEAEFQSNVTQLAATLGWHIHHDRGDYRECIGGDAGFPDLVLARAGRVIFAELKSATGHLTPSQADWLTQLGSGQTVETYLWRPADIDEIAKLLSRK